MVDSSGHIVTDRDSHVEDSDQKKAAVRHIVVMGVSGTGKTTVAQALVEILGWPYAEADDFHPQANIEKMASGHPLTDEDRWPWLRSLRDWMSEHAAQGVSTIVTCSALKRSYRDVLRQADGDVLFVELDADEDTLRSRMAQREHFMPVSLLHSQEATLQPLGRDERGIRIVSTGDPAVLGRHILKRLSELDCAEDVLRRAGDAEPASHEKEHGECGERND